MLPWMIKIGNIFCGCMPEILTFSFIADHFYCLYQHLTVDIFFNLFEFNCICVGNIAATKIHKYIVILFIIIRDSYVNI